jgi:ribonuclease P protein subunit POP4
MLSKPPGQSTHVAQTLISRAYSPTTADEIFHENVIRRPLLLRRTTAADRPTTERDARRRVREAKVAAKARRNRKPRPLSAREKRALGIHEIPKEQQKWDIFLPLHRLWIGYVKEVLGVERAQEVGVALDANGAGAALASADWHGAMVEVVRSRCIGRVGIRGIVAKETRGTFEIITRADELKGKMLYPSS